MEKTSFVEYLMEFGLTRQEASIYQCLLVEGKVTGYEVAKLTGISRSNAYNSLANMTEKGASYLVEEGTTRKYVPVPLEEFCKNRIRRLEESKKWLVSHEPTEKTHLLLLVRELEELMESKKKVVIITDQPATFENAKVYVGENRGMQIGIIADSKYVLTGEYGEGSMNTCLYSGQKNFVELYKTALSNEIKLLSIREENKNV